MSELPHNHLDAWIVRRDEDAARRLMEALHPQIIRIVQNHLPRGMEAEDLAPEQQEALRVQYDGFASDMRAIREETAKKIRDVFAKRGADIYRNLTPAQREEYRKLNDERRARWKQPTP